MGKRSIPDAFLFFQVLFFAAAVPFLLRLKLSRVEALLEPRVPSPADRDRVEQIAEYVEMTIHEGLAEERVGEEEGSHSFEMTQRLTNCPLG